MDATGTSQRSVGTSLDVWKGATSRPSLLLLRNGDTSFLSPLPLWERARVRGVSRCAAAALALLALSACGNIEPWVKPYERQALADPIMSLDPNPVSSAYIDHVYEAREGARGALGSSGGGCGCN